MSHILNSSRRFKSQFAVRKSASLLFDSHSSLFNNELIYREPPAAHASTLSGHLIRFIEYLNERTICFVQADCLIVYQLPDGACKLRESQKPNHYFNSNNYGNNNNSNDNNNGKEIRGTVLSVIDISCFDEDKMLNDTIDDLKLVKSWPQTNCQYHDCYYSSTTDVFIVAVYYRQNVRVLKLSLNSRNNSIEIEGNCLVRRRDHNNRVVSEECAAGALIRIFASPSTPDHFELFLEGSSDYQIKTYSYNEDNSSNNASTMELMQVSDILTELKVVMKGVTSENMETFYLLDVCTGSKIVFQLYKCYKSNNDEEGQYLILVVSEKNNGKLLKTMHIDYTAAVREKVTKKAALLITNLESYLELSHDESSLFIHTSMFNQDMSIKFLFQLKINVTTLDCVHKILSSLPHHCQLCPHDVVKTTVCLNHTVIYSHDGRLSLFKTSEQASTIKRNRGDGGNFLLPSGEVFLDMKDSIGLISSLKCFAISPYANSIVVGTDDGDIFAWGR